MKSSGSRWAGFAVALVPFATLAGPADLYADLAYAGSGHNGARRRQTDAMTR